MATTKRTARKNVIVDRRRPSWHFDKKLSLDTLVAIGGIAVVIGGPLVVAWRSAETRILTLEVTQQNQSVQYKQMLDDEKERRGVFAVQMKELGDKVTLIQLDVGKILATQAQQSRVISK